MPTFNAQPTPNPNSLKLTTDAGAFIDHGMEAFGSASEADAHPLGRRLFAIDGVVNVFILPAFLTVTKDPAAKWNTVLPQVETVLGGWFEERG